MLLACWLNVKVSLNVATDHCYTCRLCEINKCCETGVLFLIQICVKGNICLGQNILRFLCGVHFTQQPLASGCMQALEQGTQEVLLSQKGV